jgi:general secretion pathway protein G
VSRRIRTLIRFYKSFTIVLVAALVVSCSLVAPGRKRTGREAKLRDQLAVMRTAIDQYAADKGKLPKSLDELITAGYLREIPTDPITNKPDWKLITGEDPNGQGETGIVNIRSSSSEKSIDGQPYSEW